MKITPVSNISNSNSFKGLYTKSKISHENDGNTVGSIEVKKYYPFANETQKEIIAAVNDNTKMRSFIVDSESGLVYQEGIKVILGNKLPFTKGEWVQYVHNSEHMSKSTFDYITETLKRYNLDHYKVSKK